MAAVPDFIADQIVCRIRYDEFFLQRDNLQNQPCTPPPTDAELLRQLRALLPSRPDVDFIRTDDEFLLRFLRARKCNVQKAFGLLINYCTYRKRYWHLFEHLDSNDPEIRKALLDGIPGVTTERDAKGHRVLFFYANQWDPRRYSLLTIYRAFLLTLEKITMDKVRSNGVVIIVDWSGFNFQDRSHYSAGNLKLMMDGLQDCFPIRFEGVHMVGHPWYLSAVFLLARPFLNRRGRKKMHRHGNNLSNLHQHVAKRLLPPDLGGNMRPIYPSAWLEELQGFNFNVAPGDEQTDNVRDTPTKVHHVQEPGKEEQPIDNQATCAA